MRLTIAVGITSAALLFAAPAQASPESFFKELDKYVTGYNHDYFLGLGEAICADMHEGDDPNDLAQLLVDLHQVPSLREGQVFVEVSSDNLCPEFEVNGAVDPPKQTGAIGGKFKA